MLNIMDTVVGADVSVETATEQYEQRSLANPDTHPFLAD